MNVNAIAPGIAAALLATVAGLAVAIRRSSATTTSSRDQGCDERHARFVDEFVTKLAEFYARAKTE